MHQEARRGGRSLGGPLYLERQSEVFMASDWFDEGGAGSPVDVLRVMDSDVPVLLWQVVANGALVSVGTTSDGGALGVTVTLDGRYRRAYGREADELVAWLTEALAAVERLSASRGASSGRAPRSRRPSRGS